MSKSLHRFDIQTLIAPTDDDVAKLAAKLLINAFKHILKKQDRLVFLPSSGRTPAKTYRRLVTHYRQAIDWSHVTLVQMDEYVTNDMAPELYFQNFLQTELVKPLNIKEVLYMRKVNGGECYRPHIYVQKLSALGPIDFALHGIGRNGHIGFNEPGHSFDSEVNIVPLAAETRADNFPNLVSYKRPEYGMTLGLQTLQAVKHSILLATGHHKAAAIKGLLSRKPIEQIPACTLLNCPDFGIIIDQASGHYLFD